MDTLKWMSALPDSTRVESLNLPGTHNSSTKHIHLGLICRCQNLSVAQQLACGVRFLDIRLEKCEKGFKTVHSIIDCKHSPLGGKLYFDDIFASVRSFLDENPSESVFMLMSKDDGSLSGEEFFSIFYQTFIEPFRAYWFCENRLPLLGECRGKIVLLRRVAADAATFTDSNSGFNIIGMHPCGKSEKGAFTALEIPSLNGESVVADILLQDRYQLSGRKKWRTAVLPCLAAAEGFGGALQICYASAAGGCLMPCVNARYVNKQLALYEFDKSKYYGWIPMDFVNHELCERIIALNF